MSICGGDKGLAENEGATVNMTSRKFTVREAIARSYPTWDYDMADRLIAWLDHCGYEIVEKKQRSLALHAADEETSETVDA